jgi:hypothetical protein
MIIAPICYSAKICNSTLEAVIARIPAQQPLYANYALRVSSLHVQPPHHRDEAQLSASTLQRHKEERVNAAIMGIKHLYQLIQEHAPESIKTGEIKNQFGRKVAIVRIAHIEVMRPSLTRTGCVRTRLDSQSVFD